MTPKAQSNKSKSKQTAVHKTEKLLHSKRDNQYNENLTYGMGENFGKSYS